MGLRTSIIELNPLCRYLQNNARKKINHDLGEITLLSSNCLGGFLYHYYGMRFASPTINLLITSPDLLKISLHLEDYLAKRLEFVDGIEEYPVAKLGDITLKFVHYSSPEEAASKWYERANRINKDRLFVLMNDRDGITEEDMTVLDQSGLENVLVLTSRDYPSHRCTFQMKRYEGQPTTGNTLMRSIFTGYTRVQQAFDFTGWFNQTKGAGVKQYAKL